MTLKVTKWVAGFAMASMAGFGTAALADLAEVGAVSPDNGYPIYYGDANVLRLSLCLSDDATAAGPLCLLPAPVTLVDPALPFPDNYGTPTTFPDEAFYWNGGATMAVNGGDADLIMALEAAFFNENVIDGDQIVFGRIRIRIDNLVANEEYTITTPFGTFTEIADAGAPGPRDINVTEDIGLVQGDFSAVLNARVGPFLTPDPAAPVTIGANTYIADPNILTAVTGSVIPVAVDFGTVATAGVANFFRVEGPGVGVGSAEQCADPALGNDPVATDDCIETNQFNIMGQIANNFGAQPLRATYTLNAAGAGRVDLLATSVSAQDISVSYSGRTFSLLEDPSGSGEYFSRTVINANVPFPDPAEVTLTNNSDVPPTVTVVPLIDALTVNVATFDTNGMAADLINAFGNLALRVNSSDNRGTVTLEAFDDLGQPIDCGGTTIIPDNTLVNCATFAVGKVTVRSSAGGMADQDTLIIGPVVTGP